MNIQSSPYVWLHISVPEVIENLRGSLLTNRNNNIKIEYRYGLLFSGTRIILLADAWAARLQQLHNGPRAGVRQARVMTKRGRLEVAMHDVSRIRVHLSYVWFT
jgi:hypothetical protein